MTLEPADSDTLREQTLILLRILFAGVVFTIIHGTLYELADTPVRSIYVVGLGYALALVHYRFRRDPYVTAFAAADVTLIGCLVIQYFAGGVLASGVNCIWAIGATLMGAVLFGGKYARVGLVGFVLFVIGALAIELFVPPPPSGRPTWAWAVNAVTNVLFLGVVCTEALAFFIRQRDTARAELAKEHARSEELLERILPVSVVKRLKHSTGTIADRLEATVLFADVVGFTPMSRNAPPEVTVRLLDELFSAFDLVVEQYGLEKIKTIGDAYMAAGGVPEPRVDHAHAVALLALDLRTVVQKFRDARAVDLRLRIGMHTGPVVAGVIGRKRFTYDLWGDTVNLASRMESHGEAGEVQVTQAVYELLKDGFDFEARGTVDIKGIGQMPTWRLRGRRVTAPPG